MKILIAKRPKMAVNSYRLVSLFMRGFLRPDRLLQEREVERWLSAMDRMKASSWGKWADFTRRVLVELATPALSSTLERPLTESEALFLRAHVEEFIEGYAKGQLKQLF